MSPREKRPQSRKTRASTRRRGAAKADRPEEIIWRREEPGARRAGLSRGQIGAAALAIADAEGFDALSMRRIARELDAGTMTLYHYVRNKDELLSLMWDAVIGELILPDEALSGDWRVALTRRARTTRETFKRHPWIFGAMSQPAQSGPNGLRQFEQSLEAVRKLQVPTRDRLELIGLVEDYVFGFTLREVLQQMYDDQGDPNMAESGIAFFESELATGEYPNSSKLFRGDLATGMQRVMESFSGKANDRRFERGLKALFDGFEANRPKPKKP